MRTFDTGATRDTDAGKLDYEGFLSPLVLQRYAEYMHTHRVQADGKLRDSDNWQKGIPRVAYIKSLWRHFMDLWKEHRGIPTKDGLEVALCAILFNVMGYLHETLKEREYGMEYREAETCPEEHPAWPCSAWPREEGAGGDSVGILLQVPGARRIYDPFAPTYDLP